MTDSKISPGCTGQPGPGGEVMQRLEAKHPRAIRWMHWINVPDCRVSTW
jgi:hypothetical protein